ncbi:hypothetical protein TL16_g10288 [Triparma laevis f. inornata]|uniref:Uncharacterized protein n=2 Tax=Triparma laevis TaxID=1534972 RepID=A0A9W6Z689_9STRA|nr:hypothetical protein TrLO_g12604 [Triparma laevis f. longispina]GMH85620.1 hypothetical protein TL16_g10288 [Triparma laevis f. inornata]
MTTARVLTLTQIGLNRTFTASTSTTTIGPIFAPHFTYEIPASLTGYSDVLSLPEISSLLQPTVPLHLDLSAIERSSDIFRAMLTHYPSALHLQMLAYEYSGQYAKSIEISDELQTIDTSNDLLADLTIHNSRMHILNGDFKNVNVNSALALCEEGDDLANISNLLHLQGLAGSLLYLAEKDGDADKHLASLQTATRNSHDPRIFNNYALMTYLIEGGANDVVEMLEENYDEISSNADKASCQANITTVLLESWSSLPEGDKQRVTLLKDASDAGSAAIEMIDASDPPPPGHLKGRVLTVLGETYSAIGDGLTAEGLYSSAKDAFVNLESQTPTLLSRIHLSSEEIKLYASWERRETQTQQLNQLIETDTNTLGQGWKQLLSSSNKKIISGLQI